MHMADDLADSVFLTGKQSLSQEPYPGDFHLHFIGLSWLISSPPTAKESEDFLIHCSSEQNWGSVSKVKVEHIGQAASRLCYQWLTLLPLPQTKHTEFLPETRRVGLWRVEKCVREAVSQSSKISIIHCSIVCNSTRWRKPECLRPESRKICQEPLVDRVVDECALIRSSVESLQASLVPVSIHVQICQQLGANHLEQPTPGHQWQRNRHQDACWTPICSGRNNSTFQKEKSKSSLLAS